MLATTSSCLHHHGLDEDYCSNDHCTSLSQSTPKEPCLSSFFFFNMHVQITIQIFLFLRNLTLCCIFMPYSLLCALIGIMPHFPRAQLVVKGQHAIMELGARIIRYLPHRTRQPVRVCGCLWMLHKFFIFMERHTKKNQQLDVKL
jgi:hypothetical protein